MSRRGPSEQPFIRLVDETANPSAFAVGEPRTIQHPFPLGDAPGMPLRSRRHVRPIPPEMLRRVFEEDRALNRRPAVPALPTWREGAVPVTLGVALAIIVGALIAYLQAKGWIAR